MSFAAVIKPECHEGRGFGGQAMEIPSAHHFPSVHRGAGSRGTAVVRGTGCGRLRLNQEPDSGLVLCVAGFSLQGRRCKATPGSWSLQEEQG